MSQEQNDLITRTGPKDACGKLMRSYWQPARWSTSCARAPCDRSLLGEIWPTVSGRSGPLPLMDRHCAHRGAISRSGV